MKNDIYKTKKQLIKELDASRRNLNNLNKSKTGKSPLQKHLHFLEHAIESISEMVTITDPKDRFILVNKAFLKKYGYAKEEIIGHHVSMLQSPNTPASLLQTILQTARQEGWHGETLNRTKDGKDFILELSTSIIRDDKNEIIGLVGISKDITDRKREEKEREILWKISRLLTAPLSLKDLGLIMSHECSQILQYDAFRFNLYDKSSNVLIAVNPRESKPEDTTPEEKDSSSITTIPQSLQYSLDHPRLINRLDETPSSEFNLLGLQSKHSRSFLFAPILWENHVIAIICIQSNTPNQYGARDLKLLETVANQFAGSIVRIQEQEILRDSEKRFRLLFNKGNDAIFVHYLSTDGMLEKFIEVNEVACKRLGFTKEEFLNMTPSDIDDTGDSARIQKVIQKLLSENQVFFRQTHRTKDGRKIPVEINAQLFIYKGRQTVLSIARDLTTRPQ